MATKKNRTKKLRERRKKTFSKSEKDELTGQKRVSKNEAEEKPFDYGGLMDRDLKKNLGCA